MVAQTPKFTHDDNLNFKPNLPKFSARKFSFALQEAHVVSQEKDKQEQNLKCEDSEDQDSRGDDSQNNLSVAHHIEVPKVTVDSHVLLGTPMRAFEAQETPSKCSPDRITTEINIDNSVASYNYFSKDDQKRKIRFEKKAIKEVVAKSSPSYHHDVGSSVLSMPCSNSEQGN